MRIEVPLLPQAGIQKGSALDLRGRSRHGAPDRKIVGGPHFASAPQEDRDAVRAPQAHSQARTPTFARSKRCTGRVYPRSNRPEPSQDGQADPNARIEVGTAMLAPPLQLTTTGLLQQNRSRAEILATSKSSRLSPRKRTSSGCVRFVAMGQQE